MTDTAKRAPRATPIYLDMDRAALDAAYNNSAAVTDSSEWLAEWRARSATSRAIRGAQLDVPYGDGQRARLDYFPCGEIDAPLFVFIHGGYWQRNAKEIFSFISEGPRAHGIDVAVLGYTLAPAARLSGIVEEVREAIALLGAQAGRFGYDPNRIYVGGWSAGGHLAAVASGWPNVRGALVISGIFDLEPIALTYINDPLQLDRHEIERFSPLRLLRQGASPQCLSVGGNELSELQRQSRAYAEAADKLGLPVTLRILPGHHHFSILDELGKADGELTLALSRLIRDAEFFGR
ncbi:alpha/beta hydrolase [Bradyrhizobium sp. 149]|uniref:alpha/beta hydrolase n=1 Tax=Bradyrhizobium sp. 149 TaxID=2782624 RepID=UPI001FFA45D3|nr:alpha/beta hydrolase [Bradyrhizobium sp. 149]MCK1654747.1 alpha/beta hydrolase [Bradyrhizobium sp. 149]